MGVKLPEADAKEGSSATGEDDVFEAVILIPPCNRSEMDVGYCERLQHRPVA